MSLAEPGRSFYFSRCYHLVSYDWLIRTIWAIFSLYYHCAKKNILAVLSG